MIPLKYSFTRYLAAKRSIDDRALNRQVWERLGRELAARRQEERLQVLEVGAGIGSMFERMVEAGLLDQAYYTALDLEPEHIALARQRLADWGTANGLQASETTTGLIFSGRDCKIQLDLVVADALDFARTRDGHQEWDLLVASAFLDLVDVPVTLPLLFRLLKPGGLFYFTINFDGLTLLEPAVDPDFDGLVEQVYHRTMDERQVGGKLSGDSCTGRHLFGQLRAAGADLLESGSSDWVVYPGREGYHGDEAYFLHYIIQTMFAALCDRPEIDQARLADWANRRHEQLEGRELVFIAHQLDFLGVRPAVLRAESS